MPTLEDLTHRPADLTFAEWFAALADHLLNRSDLMVGGDPYRIAEVEAYYHGPGHADPFGHRDPVQLHRGRWYFHRTAGEYRGGSFKGLDLAFGDGTAFAGMLIRTVVDPDGVFVVGPSLTVDRLLARTGTASVAGLDRSIDGRPAWDGSSPLFLREANEPRTSAVYHTPRVGLSLKRAKSNPDMPRFLMPPYRYLTEPRAITKGKPYLALALHEQGGTAEAVCGLTGVPRSTFARYVADYNEGRRETVFEPYFGSNVDTRELCRLIGLWAVVYGKRPESESP